MTTVDATRTETASPAVASPTDPELQLLLPADDVADPEVTILIPAVNEALTITDFVAWCHEGLAAAGVVGEILIVDGSTDATPELALAAGARVLKAPRRGLGRAYIDAIPFVRGRYVIMGDADCTYDFRELAPFVDGHAGRGRVRDGLAVARLDRARSDARPAPVLRHPGHHLDLEPALRQQVHRHPLRHARASPATLCCGWGWSRSRGSTRRRWCSSRSGWS